MSVPCILTAVKLGIGLGEDNAVKRYITPLQLPLDDSLVVTGRAVIQQKHCSVLATLGRYVGMR